MLMAVLVSMAGSAIMNHWLVLVEETGVFFFGL